MSANDSFLGLGKNIRIALVGNCYAMPSPERHEALLD